MRQRLRPISESGSESGYADSMEKALSAACAAKFGTVWMNYHIQVPGTATAEIDVLAETEDADSCGVLVFEMKNRDEKNLPAVADAETFAAKISMLEQQIKQKEKKIRFVCPVYLSAEGFEPGTEAWLHEQGIFTADMDTWECS